MYYLDDKISPLFSKPKQLSDPNYDFSEDGEMLQAILDCPNENLGFKEFSCIFQGSLPAGTFNECAYYIPLALKFIASKGESSSDIADNFLSWSSYNIDDLKRYHLFDDIIQFFHDLTAEIVANFELKEYHEGCVLPTNCDLLLTIFDIFISCENISNLGEEILIDNFSTVNDYNQASWLLYLMYEQQFGIEANYDILKEWQKNETFMSKVVNTVLDRFSNSNDAMLVDFWSEKLNGCDINTKTKA